MKAFKKLSKEDILHLAKLANIELTDKEVSIYEKQLDDTLEYVENLKELDTENVKTTNHSIDVKNVNFEDGEKNERLLSREEAMKNSKNKKGNYFVVKRILSS